MRETQKNFEQPLVKLKVKFQLIHLIKRIQYKIEKHDCSYRSRSSFILILV